MARQLRDPAADGAREPEPEADPESVARTICLHLLDLRPRTRHELATALAGRGVPAQAAEAVLSRFSEVGLIDDQAYAAAWVSTRHTGRGLAGRALREELRRKGVPDEATTVALAALDPDTERDTARTLVARRLASTARLEPAARLRRLVGLLARKGYSPSLATAVVREVLAAEDSPNRCVPVAVHPCPRLPSKPVRGTPPRGGADSATEYRPNHLTT